MLMVGFAKSSSLFLKRLKTMQLLYSPVIFIHISKKTSTALWLENHLAVILKKNEKAYNFIELVK